MSNEASNMQTQGGYFVSVCSAGRGRADADFTGMVAGRAPAAVDNVLVEYVLAG